MTLIEYLRNDKELIEMRKEWKERFGKPFPPFNNDEYNGISDYKEKIKKELNGK